MPKISMTINEKNNQTGRKNDMEIINSKTLPPVQYILNENNTVHQVIKCYTHRIIYEIMITTSQALSL